MKVVLDRGAALGAPAPRAPAAGEGVTRRAITFAPTRGGRIAVDAA